MIDGALDWLYNIRKHISSGSEMPVQLTVILLWCGSFRWHDGWSK